MTQAASVCFERAEFEQAARRYKEIPTEVSRGFGGQSVARDVLGQGDCLETWFREKFMDGVHGEPGDPF